MKKLAIIPARGGSKRIPLKNIKSFLGKPIINYSIETAIKSNLFDEVMVSTDNPEIIEIAKNAGATVPFLRSPETSNDFTHVAEVISEVLLNYKSIGKEFEYFCCIYATVPFITIHRLKECYDLMINKNFDSVFPVNRFSYPIQRALKIEDEKVSMILPENFNKRSQDLMPAYHDSGQYYWMKTSEFYKQRKLFSSNSGSIILPETEAQDIDDEEDWKIAEIKYKIIHNLVS